MELPFADGEIRDAASGLALVRPHPRYLESYRQACQETWDHIHNRYILHDPAVFDQWRETIFDIFEKRFQGQALPEGWYPSLMLWAVQGDRFIGATNIRTVQDEELISYGGTLGYFIRTSERGKGYGTALAQLAVEAAQLLGIEPIVITCQESNAASMAVGEHLPYVFKERDAVSVNGGEPEPIWRYWVTDPSSRR